MSVHNIIEQNLLVMYNKLALGTSSVCAKCKEINGSLSNPVGCWLVGNKFQQQKKKILFVGKNARGYFDEPTGEKVFDDGRDLWNNGWAYWSYTAEVVMNIFGEDSPEYIAFTNIVKCNNSPDIDTTSNSMKEYCILKMRTLYNEIGIIKPTHIIFYTGKDYDDFIPNIFDEYTIVHDGIKPVGKRNMPWREAAARIDNFKFHVLRIWHPERKKKDDYVSAICDWINRNDSIHSI